VKDWYSPAEQYEQDERPVVDAYLPATHWGKRGSVAEGGMMTWMGGGGALDGGRSYVSNTA
jgi:hypothetical protein